MKKLALLLFIAIMPFAAHAGGVVNINSADSALLQTLPGIGPSKAGAIITYRTEHGPFAAIADIQDVSGIGPATYANIEALIVVDGDSTATVPAAGSSTSSSSSSSSSSGTSNTTPTNEPAVFVDAGGDRTLIAGAQSAFNANVDDKSGTAYEDPQVRWTYGDGSTAVGQSVLKSYDLPGTYLVGVSALVAGGSGTAELTVTVKDAHVAISAVSPSGITVKNTDTADALDLSYWQLASGASAFTFPAGTKIAAGGSVTFAPSITGLGGAASASLLYPSGKTAVSSSATVTAAPILQPSPPAASSHTVQTTNVIAPAHGTQAVSAPAASTQVAAAGAALAGIASTTAAAPPERHFAIPKVLKSPWVLGLLGLLVFSGGALIVL